MGSDDGSQVIRIIEGVCNELHTGSFPSAVEIKPVSLAEQALRRYASTESSTVRMQRFADFCDGDIPKSYEIAIFGVRWAIDAVRTDDHASPSAAVDVIVSTFATHDYREVIRMLGIIEACASECGLAWREMLCTYIDKTTACSQIASYLSRHDNMRELRLFGIEQHGSGSTIYFDST
ncbi:MAG: hypothetical protein AAF747_02000 [Planctomycetota bacterium]